MGMRRQISAFLAVVSACVAAGWTGVLRADLAQSSPFLPANSAAAGAQSGPAGPIELRGIMSTPQGAAYCIYDTAKKTSAWVGMNEGGNDFVVKSADPASDSVMVDYQGRSLRLVLRTAKVASAGAGGPSVAPAAPAGVPPAVVLNPTPADEQRRLEAVAQEVRRRRMERERAAQGGVLAPGSTPPSVPNR
jgi:hypothetical protein